MGGSRPVTRVALSAVVLVGALSASGACARRSSQSPQEARLGSPLPSARTNAAAADEKPRAGAASWPEAVRAGRWEDAEDKLAQLGCREHVSPEIRFVRGHVALGLGQYAEAVMWLDRLEQQLPHLHEPILKARAAAASEVGPFEIAAEWWGARSAPSAWVQAARAWEKAGQLERAKTLVDRALSAKTKSKTSSHVQQLAHGLRMRLASRLLGASAAEADARWVAIYSLVDNDVAFATESLAASSTAPSLSKSEWLERAAVLAEAGRVADVEVALEKAARSHDQAHGAKSPVPAPASGNEAITERACRLRAEALYKSRVHYTDAAAAYAACAVSSSKSSAEYIFMEGRSWSRADNDGEAARAFSHVEHKFPGTSWASEAEFHMARMLVLAGQWEAGAAAFDALTPRLPRGDRHHEAARYHAIAHLLAGHHRKAAELFDALAARAGSRDSRERLANLQWRNLAALAVHVGGDRIGAIARWREVLHAAPWSWAGWVARSRLAAIEGPSAPAPVNASEGAGAGANAAAREVVDDPARLPAAPRVELPPPVDSLHAWGLDGEAERMLRERESRLPGAGGLFARTNVSDACRAYGELGRAKRRYQWSLQIPASLLDRMPSPDQRWAWECAYPKPFEASVRTHVHNTIVPSELVWAVMRQESAFDEEAVSPAQAVGLLQVMPSTARAVAAKASLAYDDARVAQPDYNIRVGALYLDEMLNAFERRIPLAVAAYNAGPEAVSRWRSKLGAVPLDVFVELIPFVETRGYVAKVMGNLARYTVLQSGSGDLPPLELDSTNEAPPPPR